MGKMYLRVILLLCVLLTKDVYAQTMEERSYTIEQMFELAEQNNSRIKAYTTAVEQSQAEVKVAQTAYLPSVNVSLSLSYNGDGVILDRDFGNSFTAEIPGFGNNFVVEVSQVIYAGGAISGGMKMAELQSQIASLDAERNRQEVRFLIVGNYLELCKLDNQLKVFDAHIAQTEKVLTDMRIRYNQGAALSNDITRYELQLQNLNYSKTQLLNAKQILNNRLTVALGLPNHIAVRPGSFKIDLVEDKDIMYWQKEASNSSIQLNIMEKTVQLTQQKEKISNSERLPQVALFATNNLTGPVTIEIPALNKNFNYWFVGIGVKYNLSSLYKTPKRLKSDRLGIQKAQENLLVAQEETTLAIDMAYTGYREAYTLLEIKNKSVELATGNYELVNYRYANDLATITDLLDASSQKLDAELQRVNAHINILYNYYKLHYITGTL